MKSVRGRFRTPLHPKALEFSSSLPVDRRLYAEDIAGSLAHVAMLARQRIIPPEDARAIRKALGEIQREIASGRLVLKPAAGNRFAAEDIHMAIEHRLVQKLGARGGKLHAGRSRNDQVALDERLFLRDAAKDISGRILALQKSLLDTAARYQDVLMPGYTHLQRAQPVLLAHHLLAYVSMFDRDAERFDDLLGRLNRSPLGAAAIAGTSLPIDRESVARQLRFDGIIENSIDAVSDRDVQIEFLAAGAIAMMHLSRLAEELVLWSSQEWSFVDTGEAFTTGSSIMPQKKNPDMAELVRGRTGRVYGNLVALLTVMKGLPLAYNRDMQEDKEPLFDTSDTLSRSLELMALMMRQAKFHRHRFEEELSRDMVIATDLAEYLVHKGVAFRKAHQIVGTIVRSCLKNHSPLSDLPLAEYRTYSRHFGPDILSVLDVRKSLSRKASSGSTSPAEVRKSLRMWKQRLRASRRKRPAGARRP